MQGPSCSGICSPLQLHLFPLTPLNLHWPYWAFSGFCDCPRSHSIPLFLGYVVSFLRAGKDFSLLSPWLVSYTEIQGGKRLPWRKWEAGRIQIGLVILTLTVSTVHVLSTCKTFGELLHLCPPITLCMPTYFSVCTLLLSGPSTPAHPCAQKCELLENSAHILSLWVFS